jgi:hypothetical protein
MLKCGYGKINLMYGQIGQYVVNAVNLTLSSLSTLTGLAAAHDLSAFAEPDNVKAIDNIRKRIRNSLRTNLARCQIVF